MTREKHLVLVINSLQSGGAEKQMLWIAESLVGMGWQVTVVELAAPRGLSRINALAERAAEGGVALERARTGQSYFRSWLRLYRTARRCGTGTVLWSWGLRADLGCGLVRLLAGRKFTWVCSLRNANRDGIATARWFYRAMRCFIAGYVSNTQANIDLLEEFCGGVNGRCWVLPNVLEELALPPKQDSVPVSGRRMRVAMLGNIDIHRKGYDTAIEVARLLKDGQVPAQIVVAGRPDDAGWLEARVAEFGLQEVLVYAGETTRPREFLVQADLFLLLSRYEGNPNALLEALAIGLPAIVTRVGDLERADLTEPPFHLVDIHAPVQVINAINRCLHDPAWAWSMGRRGRQWCENQFSTEKCRAELRSITLDLMESEKVRR